MSELLWWEEDQKRIKALELQIKFLRSEIEHLAMMKTEVDRLSQMVEIMLDKVRALEMIDG